MLQDTDRATLLDIARLSITYGLQHGREMHVTPGDYSPALQELRASFVTLTIRSELRGCIGTLEAYQPLVEDVAHNAYSAAFHDPRFPRLTSAENENLQYHISILSAAETIHFKSEQELLSKLQPGVDGLVLQEGRHRGTFLPQVWKSLPQPEQFLRQLKLKAGLPEDYWSKTIMIERYTVEEF